jgi:hypothetical protein
VRPLDEQAAVLVAEAQQNSATVRNLVEQLGDGDVVAYVQVVSATPNGPLSGLQFVGASHTVRFVLIQIANCQAPCRRIELLGHELQHATEVAATAWVTDNPQLQRLMAFTGWPDASTARRFETAAAGQAERLVRRDLRAVTGSAQ